MDPTKRLSADLYEFLIDYKCGTGCTVDPPSGKGWFFVSLSGAGSGGGAVWILWAREKYPREI